MCNEILKLIFKINLYAILHNFDKYKHYVVKTNTFNVNKALCNVNKVPT